MARARAVTKRRSAASLRSNPIRPSAWAQPSTPPSVAPGYSTMRAKNAAATSQQTPAPTSRATKTEADAPSDTAPSARPTASVSAPATALIHPDKRPRRVFGIVLPCTSL